MAKAMFIMNMPEVCNLCFFCCSDFYGNGERVCSFAGRLLEIDTDNDKPGWCPLIEMPQREPEGDTACFVDGEPMTNELAEQYMSAGWNHCIDVLEAKANE